MSKPVLTIQNARLIYRNFRGKATDYTPEGKRTVCVVLDKETAEVLKAAEWNVRHKKDDKDPQDEGFYYLSLNVNYNGEYPPRITMLTRGTKTPLNEETVGILDVAEIEFADVTINPSRWNVGGKTGLKGYVKTMFVKIVDDELEMKYADVPDSDQSPLDGD